MKLKKVLTGTLAVGLSLIAPVQMFGATNVQQYTAMNTAYVMKDSAKSAALEAEYKKKMQDVIKDYLNTDVNKLPKDAKYEFRLRDRASIKKISAEVIKDIEKDYKEKIISKKEYEESVAEEKLNQKKTYDEICCTLSYKTTGKECDYDTYAVVFNADTKEVISILAPFTVEGEKIMDKNLKPKVSVKNFKQKYAELIKKYKIGGIQDPECVKEKDTLLLTLSYQDKKDANKKVDIVLEPATGEIYSLNVK